MTSEELKALLAKEASINAAEEDSAKTLAARKRAAKDWISHFVYIKKFRQELIDGGMPEAEVTADSLTKALVAKWEESADIRETEAI